MRKLLAPFFAFALAALPCSALPPARLVLLFSNAPGAPNQLNNSQVFNGASWAITGVVITDNAALAPDGSLTAASFIWSANNQIDRQIIPGASAATQTATFCASMYLKGSITGGNAVRVSDLTAANSFAAAFRPNTGAVQSSSVTGTGSLIAFGSVPIGSGWFRVWVMGRLPVSTPYFVIGNQSGVTGTASIWGAQLEIGTEGCPGPYRYKP